MKRFKQPKTAITVPRKELERIKRDIAKETTEKACLLVLLAAIDEVGLNENQFCNIAMRSSRYANYIDGHIVELEDLRKSIEKNTGVKLKGRAT